MPITVFYSWQSERPEKFNRYFIRDALNKAMTGIQQNYGLEERLEVDHDTKGIPGTPDIVNTIFSKIKESSAFVADVTFTSKSSAGRLCANGNVLIELGFALSSLGDERLILVMNDAFGSPKDKMPFNLVTRRWPITFTLSPEADKQTYQKAFKDLVSKLSQALQTMADSGVLFTTPATSSSVQSDRLLFAKFLEQFPSNGKVANFLKEWDLGNSFPRARVGEIEHFTEEWRNAQHEFIDSTLEDKRVDLIEKLDSFQHKLVHNTWTSDVNPDYLSMELDDFDDGSHRWQIRDELNEMATAAYEAHQELIRACKVRLGSSEIS